jgi:lysosomal alpha-glucosidase
MFKVTNMTRTPHKVTAELVSKVADKETNDDQVCVESSEGDICDTDHNKLTKSILAEISVIGANMGRAVYRDRENDQAWDVSKLPGFLGEKNPDGLFMMDSIGFTEGHESNFGFAFEDIVSQKTLFDSRKRRLVVSDKYLEVGFVLPSQVLFGLGQHNSKFLLTEGKWTMFNRDQPGSPIAEADGNAHLYGTHPFLMAKTEDDKFVGILFYNSNPQQVEIRYSTSGKSLINYKTIGGILDIYFFLSGTADEVIRNYNNLVGKPVLPPFWSLGFHQCSWQYNSTKDLKEVFDTYTKNGYLIDTMWTDIMYMDRYIDFTINETAFGDLSTFVEDIQKDHYHYVPIIDAGISIAKPTNGTDWFQKGQDMDVFIKSTKNPDKYNGTLIGEVWPGLTGFVDFFHPNSSDYWIAGLQELKEKVNFEGIWLDMNEPS